jgi:hypothetical protein
VGQYCCFLSSLRKKNTTLLLYVYTHDRDE